MNQSRLSTSIIHTNNHYRDYHPAIGQIIHKTTFLQHSYDLRNIDGIVMAESGRNLVVAEAPTAPDRFPRTPMCVIVTSAYTRPGSQKLFEEGALGKQTAASVES
jgi:hypothetical protein